MLVYSSRDGWFGRSGKRLAHPLTMRKAGLADADLHFHDTRHEGITRLAAVLGVLELARAVGHRDLRMLQTYYNESAEDIAKKLK